VSVEDDKRLGQTSTSKMTENVEKIRGLVNEDCHRTISELTDTIGMSYGVCQANLTENFNMRCIAPLSRQHARPHIPVNHRVCD
jgi:hypothetical protein